jgi:F420-dependent oxidoreductase-like protein
MKLGFSVGNFSWPIPTAEIGPKVTRLVQAADAAGFDSFYSMDHFFQIAATGAPPEDPILESYATLAYVAAKTEQIRLGTLVTCAVYRHPGALIKAVTAIDVLSGGRAILGIGAGWYEEEARGLGLPFPPVSERFERLEEQLQIAHLMWSDEEKPFDGTHYTLERTLNSPNSIQRPHPPIMVGGGGEKKTLRLVAQYADACNLVDPPGAPLDVVSHKLDVLRGHCDAVGRDYDTIERTAMSFLDLGDDTSSELDRLLGRLTELGKLGIDHIIFVRGGPWDEAAVEAVASIVPEIHAIETRA